jgi:hypothetical protein
METIAEFKCSATTAALNAALLDQAIRADKIIGVLYEPSHHGLMTGDYQPQFRVLYRHDLNE